MSDNTHITTWVTREMKQRFAALARERDVSESALLKHLIELMLQPANIGVHPPTADDRARRETRFSIRLRPEDQLLLRERARARGLPAATYVSVLVRAHLRLLAPLPKEELLALKRTVSELGAVGRNLNQLARAANQGERVGGSARDELRALLKVCEGLRDHVKALLAANVRSWSQGYGEPL
jgi:predicted DNA binding CopG/RHH family protein